MELTPEELELMNGPAQSPPVPGWSLCAVGHMVAKRPDGAVVPIADCETCKLIPEMIPADLALPDPLERVPDGWTDAVCPVCTHAIGKRPAAHVVDPITCPNYPHEPRVAAPEKVRKPRAKKVRGPDHVPPPLASEDLQVMAPPATEVAADTTADAIKRVRDLADKILRDEFAKAALPSCILLADPGIGDSNATAADNAYAFADAMLAARKTGA